MQKIKNAVIGYFDRLLTGNSMNYRQVFAIIIPLVIDQAFIICLSVLNTAMISSSGVAAVSAVGMVDSLNIFLVNVFIAVATGGTVVVAQYKGAGNETMVKKAASQSLAAVGLLSISLAALMIIFHVPILNLLFMKAEPAVMENAKIFIIGSCISYPFIAIVEAICGVLRGTGQAKSSLGLSLVMNFAYVILNVLFISIMQMGIVGMVISLITSRGIGMIVSIIYLVKYNKELCFKIKDVFIVDFPLLKKILFIGLPFAAEQMFFNGGKLLTQTFIVELGTMAIATNTISNVITNLFQIVANGLSLAAVTVVGQCIGRRDIDDARKFIKSFLKLASLSYIVVAIILLPLYPLMIKIFLPPQEIVGTIFFIITMTAIAMPFLWPISFIIPSSLRAAGDSKFTSIVSLLSMWLFRVVLGYILGVILPFGITGVWFAMIAEWGIRGFVFWKRFKGTKWYQYHLID